MHALVQKRVNVINVLTSSAIRVRNGSSALMIIPAINHMGEKQQVDYYFSESCISVTLVFLQHA